MRQQREYVPGCIAVQIRSRDRRRHEPSTDGKLLKPRWIAWPLLNLPFTVRGVRPVGFPLPLTLSYRDPSSPFVIEATVIAGHVDDRGPGQWSSMTLTIGAGSLHDADKGTFPLNDLELAMRVADGRIEPIAVRNPGVLSEFQQDGLLDAVTSALNDINPTTIHLKE